MSKTDCYYSINKKYGPVEFKEKGSRFISYLFPITDKTQADVCLGELHKKYHDSTHICYAYRIGQDKEEYYRVNDDGEPSGSAGIPIYNEIKGKEYMNVLAAVIRYFGGVKLGVGGLTRAYGHSAKLALDISERVEFTMRKEVSLVLPYDFLGDIMQIVNRFDILVRQQDFNPDGVLMNLEIPLSQVEIVAKLVNDRSFGKIKLKGS